MSLFVTIFVCSICILFIVFIFVILITLFASIKDLIYSINVLQSVSNEYVKAIHELIDVISDFVITNEVEPSIKTDNGFEETVKLSYFESEFNVDENDNTNKT